MSLEHDPVAFRVSRKHVVRLSQLRYFTFTLIGLALLWPWNCFLSASAYYDDRFKHSPSLVKIYSSTMMSVSLVASAAYNFYLSQVQAGVNYKHRLHIGLVLTILVFLVMAVSCVSDLFIKMPDSFFFLVLMLMVFVSAMATCLAQNGTMALVNVMGGIYANAVMVGQAVAGVLPVCVLIVSIMLVGDKPIPKGEDSYSYVEKNFGVFTYYITASLISVGSIALFCWINKFKVENTYSRLNDTLEADSLDECEEGVFADPSQKDHVPFMLLWDKLKYIVLTIFITFCVTLVFPVFALRVESTHYLSSSQIFQKKIYIPIAFLVWNIGDLLGRILCGTKYSILIRNPKTLLWYSVARLLFIPLFLTCNIHPEEDHVPIISSDLWYMLLQLLFGLSNGQLSTSSFMTVADNLDTDSEKEAAGGFTSVFVSLGLAIGSLLSYLLVIYIK